jgi:hypothetical protein
MTLEQKAEQEMIKRQTTAARSMREASQEPHNQALWEQWQADEVRAEEARKRWLALKKAPAIQEAA